jgi:TPP-dependent trihydroxycyclohexane-1,2-dione (THcHDO) dehydratase
MKNSKFFRMGSPRFLLGRGRPRTRRHGSLRCIGRPAHGNGSGGHAAADADGHGNVGDDGAGHVVCHRREAGLAYPDRPSVAVVGDGGFAMLMAELTTAVANKLAVKIVILKNNSLAEVKFEKKQIGNPEYGCTLSSIDFVAFAKACGAEGFRCERPEEVRTAIQAALNSPGPAIVEAVVDAEEKPAKPEELRA